MSLSEQIEAKRRELANLEQAAKTATCREFGAHRWKSIGGRRCDCDREFSGCSVPVNECEVCGACDYGENEEARRTMADCKP